MFGFEKLDVWQKAIEYSTCVYQATSHMPMDERFGLVTQLRRASVSVSSNIAEGSSRTSGKDFGRFIEVAYGSVLETVSQMHLAKRLGLVNDLQFNELSQRAVQLARMLSGLKSSVQKTPPDRSARHAGPWALDPQP